MRPMVLDLDHLCPQLLRQSLSEAAGGIPWMEVDADDLNLLQVQQSHLVSQRLL